MALDMEKFIGYILFAFGIIFMSMVPIIWPSNTSMYLISSTLISLILVVVGSYLLSFKK
jgi:uncharacterized Fe-S radical SAM superfamily protein PflX